ncbi:MAG: excinuclease ABC subunit UvrA [Puniceicoccales bacterium]|jgi:excinuclease ABC subunit A|nr:excinuclease ABC subunit UvrA [Puniceicoccales bacterium]
MPPSRKPDTNFIRIRDARQNNLQGCDLDIPTGKVVVVTGLSGAGKSSLVFDTLYAEGQRRYVETFSPYTRQFLELMPAPKVGRIENIRPSIAIQQGNTVKTSRSTVGTMTGLCDWFKVWYAHRAQLHDPATGGLISEHHPESVWAVLTAGAGEGGEVLAGFAVARPAGMDWGTALAPFIAQGYTRGVFGGALVKLVDLGAENAARHEGFVLQDRVALAPENKARFIEAATAAFRLGQGRLAIFNEKNGAGVKLEAQVFCENLTDSTGRRFRPAAPALFSFNSPIGACPVCRGFGRVIGLDWAKIIPDETKSIAEGAIAPFQGKIYGESQRDLERCAKKQGLPLNVAWKDISEQHRDFVINGEPGYGTGNKKWPRAWYGIKDFFTWLEGNAYKMHVRVFLSRFRSYTTCGACGGLRLQPEALCWKWRGFSLPQLYALPVSELLAVLRPHHTPHGRHPAEQALDAILVRLAYLEEVGLGYLALDRQSRTLSGGEAQRVNLTACLGAALADALFVLDEPSVGLHPRDLGRMIGVLRLLAQQGNTVVVVEHDESVMRAADYLVEIGPLPGRRGGRVVYSGEPAGIVSVKDSPTGAWLSRARTISAAARRPVDGKTPRLRLRDICANNLRGLNLEIPLGHFVGVCGVSGSGKSTLLNEILARVPTGSAKKRLPAQAAARVFRHTSDTARFAAACDIAFTEIARVDQSPVSRTPRSNTALYCGAWEAVRRRLAASPEAGESGFTTAHFSFNSGDGRCPRCGGSGWETVEMQFLADVHVPCPECDGRRFRREILAFKFRGKTVADLLEMTVDEACEFFAEDAAITRTLALPAEVGLGYLSLGQSLNTLSGGEAQRLKLVRFLQNFGEDEKESGGADNAPGGQHALILLDEPTTGLHREDVARLLSVLQRLTNAGHSLVVVEHNSDVLNAADWLLELGPEAGEAGGLLVAEGTPELVASGKTPSAPYLAKIGSHRTG